MMDRETGKEISSLLYPALSPDGKYVGCNSSFGDNDEGTIALYPVNSFARPAFTLPNRYYPVSFDKEGNICAKAIKDRVLDIFPQPAGGKVEPRHHLWSCGDTMQDL